ncbi:DUF2079 domain-containing protein [Leptospira yanagawae]|uniref:DUF2079 domain-containing protein n=1 Tax=Leptospira yanagawae TaxID=293069 RepID=A0ABY2M4R7_9LEPT|nr:DUF2079 domain-containing protein [Leptospira yanagawae]TGL22457.1 DUF2079 domain-containing protein [Leptospira yanagawae]
MIYLFFLSSLVTSFLFVSPKNFHAPLQKGVSLLYLFLCIYSFWKKKYGRHGSDENLTQYLSPISIQNQKRILPYLVGISGFCFVLASTVHAYQLTNFFASSFLFHDADYIGISDILLSVWEGKGFESHYYSESTNGSYLHHHFAPGMFFLSPFVGLVPNRYGLAVGVFFYYQLATILWLYWAYRSKQKNNANIPYKFLVFWVVLTNQLYLYRIGSSYHFEILAVVSGFFFFFQWNKIKSFGSVVANKTKSHLRIQYLTFVSFGLSLLFFLSQKEDIGIYLVLFLLPQLFYECYQGIVRKKIKSWKDLFSLQKHLSFALQILIFGITFLYLVYVFFLYPYVTQSDSHFIWSKILTQDYHSSFKQVTSVSKSIQIFLEIIVSGGIGILQLVPECLGIGFIYLTHFFSSRPWHHEVYSYYSYSLVSFLLYSGILWLKSEKQISLPIVFLILSCLFWKNAMDQNFPLKTESKETWYDQRVQSEVVEDLIMANTILNSDSHPIQSKVPSNEPIVFSQYNLAFFITEKTKLYPLEHLPNQKEICRETNVCYVVIAPQFTDEKLWPKKRIFDTFEGSKFLPLQKIWQGKQVEVWKRIETN